MSVEATSTVQITGWDEKPYQEFEGGVKLTRAKVTHAYQGAIAGEGSVEYLMSYTVNGTAIYVGIEWVKGVVAGKSGSFVAQHIGKFEGDEARSTWSIVTGSGTGELAALRGEGSFVAPHGSSATISFHYDFEPNV